MATADSKLRRYKRFISEGLSQDPPKVPKTTAWRKKRQLISGHTSLLQVVENYDASFQEPRHSREFNNVCSSSECKDDGAPTPQINISQMADTGHNADTGRNADTGYNTFQDPQYSRECDNEHPTDMPYPGAAISNNHSVLLLTAFIIRHHVNGQMLEDLLELINCHCPGLVPKSKYIYLKNIVGKCEPIYKYYCCDCLGLIEDGNCVECGVLNTINMCKQNGQCFVYIPVEEVLKNMLSCKEIQDNLNFCFQQSESYIRNIQDGKLHRDAKKCGQLGSKDITLMWNCDGVPLFQSSKSSIHPLQATICELNYDIQKKHVLLLGIWFGATKPRIDVFLQTFVDDMNRLSRNGVYWTDKYGHQHQSKVFALINSSDAVARPLLRNATQFNGQNGCDWCDHPGETVARGHGHTRVYRIGEVMPKIRTHDEIKDAAIEAGLCGETVKGIKGPSILLFLQMFNMVHGFVPDYLHCVLLGVMRQLCNLWFDTSNHMQQWYLGGHVNEINLKLKAIRPPSEVSRTPRTINECKYWKASEWRSFLLYYGPTILVEFLQRKFYDHFMLLFYGVYHLLKEEIPVQCLEHVNTAFMTFVVETENLYGIEHVSFNIHQLTHLVQSVVHCGPLWQTSSFIFEGNNQNLLQMNFGTTYIPQQIANRYLLKDWLDKNRHIMDATEEKVKAYFSRLCGDTRLKAERRHINNVTLLGTTSKCVLNETELTALNNLNLPHDIDTHVGDLCSRFLVKNILYMSTHYMRIKKRFNCTVRLNTNIFVNITKGFAFSEKHFVIIGRELKVIRKFPEKNMFMSNLKHFDFMSIVRETDNVIAFSSDSISNKCILLPFKNDQVCVIDVPNSKERD